MHVEVNQNTLIYVLQIFNVLVRLHTNSWELVTYLLKSMDTKNKALHQVVSITLTGLVCLYGAHSL